MHGETVQINSEKTSEQIHFLVWIQYATRIRRRSRRSKRRHKERTEKRSIQYAVGFGEFYPSRQWFEENLLTKILHKK